VKSAAAFGVPGLLGLLVVIEAGIPLPIPGDLLMLLVGERAAAGAFPLWAAAAGLELVAIVGTSALFFGVRGPAGALVARLGPRVGLTEARLSRASDLLQRRGSPALVVGRTTPGLRTVTVLAAASSKLPARRCLPLLVAGSTIFLQAHLLLGYLLGPLADAVLARAGLVLVGALVLLLAAGLAIWLRRRGRGGVEAWTEAGCPACLAVALLERRTGIR